MLIAVIRTHVFFCFHVDSRKPGSQAGILEGIEDHCSDSMKVDFRRLDLARAGCAVWYIACEGKLKVRRPAFGYSTDFPELYPNATYSSFAAVDIPCDFESQLSQDVSLRHG